MIKKILVAAAAILAVATVSAQTQTIFANTDYTRATGNTWYSNYENRVGFTVTPQGNFGTFDALFIYNVTKQNNESSTKGGEAGWSMGTKVDQVDLTGRVAAGGVAYNYYYVLQGEAKYTLDSDVQPVVQYRFRDGFNADYLAENRFLLGADFKLAKDVGLRIGYTYTAVKGPDLNGLSAAINYGF